MQIKPEALKIRSKILGVLIRDVRQASGENVQDCAQAIGVTPAIFEGYELGEGSPSLPELELLAYYLDVPLEHFWGRKVISEATTESRQLDRQQLVGLRQRVIGTLVRQARNEAGLSLEESSENIGMTPAELETCELGESPLSLPHLEAISNVLNHPIQQFMDKHGPVGAWASQRRTVEGFLELPTDLQEFVAKPVNHPYLELAQRLSEMSVEKLRAVGEGILEITL